MCEVERKVLPCNLKHSSKIKLKTGGDGLHDKEETSTSVERSQISLK
jgi:hypothetical protein